MRAVLLAVVLVLMSAAPAAAHPFGPPSTARVSADGVTVSLSWLAAEDDWVALGQSLGAFTDPAANVTGEEKLQRSPAVRSYLLERFAVTQGGRPCPGRLAPLSSLLTEGARLTFDCAGPVSDVDIRVDALTDLNGSYRTVLTSDTPASPDRALFTAEQDTVRVSFGTASGGAVLWLALGAGVVAVAGVGVLLVRRRARR